MVEDKETDTAVKGHEQEQACEVMVYDTAISVGKGTKTRILAIDLSSSIAMRFISRQASYAGPGNTERHLTEVQPGALLGPLEMAILGYL